MLKYTIIYAISGLPGRPSATITCCVSHQGGVAMTRNDLARQRNLVVNSMREFEAFLPEHLERLMASHRFIHGGDASYTCTTIQNGPSNRDYFIESFARSKTFHLTLFTSKGDRYLLEALGDSYDFLNHEHTVFLFRMSGYLELHGMRTAYPVGCVGYYDTNNSTGFVLIPNAVLWGMSRP